MVMNGNPEARDKAREALVVQGKSKVEVLEFLLRMAKTMDQAESLSNKELIAEVTDTIWAQLTMDSRESAVLGEMIHRAKKMAGLPVEAGS
jgi:hypothetical protein